MGEGKPEQPIPTPPVKPREDQTLPLVVLEPSGNEIDRLARRLKEIQDENQQQREKLTLLAKNVNPGTQEEQTPSVEPIDYSQLETQVRQFIDLPDQDITADVFLVQTGEVVIKTKNYLRSLNEEIHRLDEQQNSLDRKKREVLQAERELEGVSGIRRVLNPLERRRLEAKEKACIGQIESVTAKLEEKRRTEESFDEQLGKLIGKQEDIFLEEGKKSILAARQKYEGFISEVETHPELVGEIREGFIRRQITPKLEELVVSEKATREEVAAFLQRLRTDLVAIVPGDERAIAVKKELTTYINQSKFQNLIYDFDTVCSSLVRQQDQVMLRAFIGDIARKDITAFKQPLQAGSRSWRGSRIADSIIPRILYPTSLSLSDSELPLAQFNFDRLVKDHSDISSGMPFWEACKESGKMKQLFGDLITQKDEEIYRYTLDSALDDGNGTEIQRLTFYPRPEAIKEVVLLATVAYDQHRVFYANSVLANWARRADWPQLIDEAERKYPALSKAKAVLAVWDFVDYVRHPELRDHLDDFCLAILTEAKDEKRVIQLAQESLSTEGVLNYFAGKGKIEAGDALAINQALSFVKEYEGDKQANGLDISSLFFDPAVRNCFLIKDLKKEEELQPWAAGVKRIAKLARKINANQNNLPLINYLVSSEISRSLGDPDIELSSDQLDLLLRAPEICPALVSSTLEEEFALRKLLLQYYDQFLNEAGLQFFQRMSASYKGRKNQIISIIGCVSKGKLTRERAEELPQKAAELLEGEDLYLVTSYPEVFLSTDEDVVFFKNLKEKYSPEDLKSLALDLGDDNISREMCLRFPDHLPALMADEWRGTRIFLFHNARFILRDESDCRFLNNLVGRHGKVADQLIRDYGECVRADAITAADRDLVLEFTDQFRVLSPNLIRGYREAKQTGTHEVYLAGIRDLAEKMIGVTPITEKERQLPYYSDIVRAIYPQNSGQWTTYENNASCDDRSADLAGFKIEPRYKLDLMRAADISLKEGEALDAVAIDALKEQVYSLARSMEEYGYDPEEGKRRLSTELDERLQAIKTTGGLENIELAELKTDEEKLFILMTEAIYGDGKVDPKEFKSLVMKYEFTHFQDVRDYIQGTNDRVTRSNNPDYALLCELHNFFSDRIKEVNRTLVANSWENPLVAQVMPQYFDRLREMVVTAEKQDQLHRMRVDNLGLTDAFIQRIARTLAGKTGRTYAPDQVREIIARYEKMTGGLTEKTSTSPKVRTKAFYGQLRAQRDQTMAAVKTVSGEAVQPTDFHLGEINLQEMLEQQRALAEGVYDEEKFASYTIQRFLGLFDEEKDVIERELDKFVSSLGKQREVIYGYITKTKESANARMTGGVCVSGDNPQKVGKACQWNMENYLQLVFQDPDTYRCQGLCLMHHYQNKDGKTLAVSLNPSSTYLLSVEEKALFQAIYDTLVSFADANGFDRICMNASSTIRTNRTGGEFEKAINAAISRIGKKYTFSEPQVFSYIPKYYNTGMDVIWEKPVEKIGR